MAARGGYSYNRGSDDASRYTRGNVRYGSSGRGSGGNASDSRGAGGYGYDADSRGAGGYGHGAGGRNAGGYGYGYGRDAGSSSAGGYGYGSGGYGSGERDAGSPRQAASGQAAGQSRRTTGRNMGQAGYQAGFSAGYADGFPIGRQNSEPLDTTKPAGYQAGYRAGYAAGLATGQRDNAARGGTGADNFGVGHAANQVREALGGGVASAGRAAALGGAIAAAGSIASAGSAFADDGAIAAGSAASAGSDASSIPHVSRGSADRISLGRVAEPDLRGLDVSGDINLASQELAPEAGAALAGLGIGTSPSGSERAASRAEASTPNAEAARYSRANYGKGTGSPSAYGRGNYGSHAQGEQVKRARRLKTAKRVGIGVACALAALLAAAAIYIFWFMGALDRALAPDKEQLEAIDAQLTRSSLDDPFYVLVLGSDSREGSGVDSDTEYADSYADGQERADVIMLVRVDARAKQLTLVSIPRDTPVANPNGGMMKINETYNQGGAAATIKAVSEITGVGIAHYAEVRISGMQAIVDELGGIEVNVDRELKAKDTLTGEQLVLEPGLQTLDGKMAQVFLRARHAYSDTGNQDGSRQNNVRAFVQAVIKKALSKPLPELPGTVLSLAEHVTSDFTAGDLISLATKFGGNDVTMYSCSGPADGAIMEQYDGLWLCYPNPEGWAELMRQVDAGLKPGKIDYAATAIVE